MSKQYSQEEFAKHLNSTFQIRFTPDLQNEASLIKVSDLTVSGAYESFAITFLVQDDCPVRQQIYEIGHAEMGKFDLFLVPSGQDGNGTTYVSVFNYAKR